MLKQKGKRRSNENEKSCKRRKEKGRKDLQWKVVREKYRERVRKGLVSLERESYIGEKELDVEIEGRERRTKENGNQEKSKREGKRLR